MKKQKLVTVYVVYFRRFEVKEYVAEISKRQRDGVILVLEYARTTDGAHQWLTEEEACNAISRMYNPHHREYNVEAIKVPEGKKPSFHTSAILL